MPVRAHHLVCLFAAALLAQQSWKDKPAAAWSQEDAREVLAGSPWVKPAAVAVKRDFSGPRMRRGGLDMGGLSMGGIGMGESGMGGPRGARGGGPPHAPPGKREGRLPAILVRWESAVPVQEAHLKLRHTDAPEVDEDSYTIAVLGLDNRVVGSDPADLENQIRSRAELAPAGRKPIPPSGARVLPRDDGLIVLFTFPRRSEVSARDKEVKFKAQIGPYEVTCTFELTEMTYRGRLEL